MHTRPLAKPQILRLAAEADVDPRSVQRELRALQGTGKPVRGRSGERLRSVLAKRGILPGRVSSA